MGTQNLPCEKCAEAGQRFEDHGFRVLGCEPLAGRPGMCRIRYAPQAAARPRSRSLKLKPTLELDLPSGSAAGAAETGEAAQAAEQGDTLAGAGASASAITPTQARTAQAIVNLFETGAVLGEYGQVTLLPGDPGRLTYGRSQTTIGSGNLHQLLLRYCQNPGARFGLRLQPFLPAFAARDEAPDTDSALHNLLRACADDPVMRETQDAFFDEAYWRPALRTAERLGLRSPLAVAVVYDSHVHGSWNLIRDRTRAAAGEPAEAGEREWIPAFVAQRRAWLASHKITLLRSTVYRMDAFQRLIDQGFWGLELPLVVRDSEISTATLSAMPPRCYDGPQPGSRPLGLEQPLLRGLDVRLLQLGLSDRGAEVKADGVFGQASVRCVKELQIARGLPVTGFADVALISELVR